MDELKSLGILAARLMEARGCAIWLYDGQHNKLNDDVMRYPENYEPLFDQAVAAAQQGQRLKVSEDNFFHYHIPIIHHDAVKGVVELLLEDDDIDPLVLENVIEHLALFIEKREEAERLQKQVNELEFIRRADREMSSRLDPDRIVILTMDWALRRTYAEGGMILGVDAVSLSIASKEMIGFLPEEMKRFQQRLAAGHFSVTGAMLGNIIKNQTPTVITEFPDDENYIQPLRNNSRSILITPLLSNRRTVGVVWLESDDVDRFDSDAVDFIERIASMAAIAIDNAQLLAQAEQLADDMSLIYNGARTISSSLELDDAIQRIAQGIAVAVRGSVAMIYSYDGQEKLAQLLSTYSLAKYIPDTLPQEKSFWNLSHHPSIVQAINTSQLITISLDNPKQADEHEWLEGLGVRVAAITPLTAQGTVVGLVVLLKADPPYEYAPSEIFVAESLATQAAAVLRQATLYTEVRDLETLKSEVIRMTSHDLRAPIANATGYLSLLEADIQMNMLDALPSYIDAIQRSLERMDNLVTDILTIEKIEAAAEDWEIFAIQAVIDEVVLDQKSQADQKLQTLLVEAYEENTTVKGNQSFVREALSNFVTNAIKYTPDGGKIIVKSFINDEKHRVYCEVIDNGYGVDPSRQHRLFERFYRAKQPGTENITGTGLGLSLVKSIIERHHGMVYFESVPNGGSTFGFWLPIMD